MRNKLKISCATFLSMVCITNIVNAEILPNENTIGIKNSTPMCLEFGAVAVDVSGNELSFGTTEGQYLREGQYFLSRGDYEKVYLTDLKFYQVTDPLTCANAELVAEYEFTGAQDMCKINPGITGGLVDARNSMQIIDINYELLWTGEQGYVFGEGTLSCDNAHASIYESVPSSDKVIIE